MRNDLDAVVWVADDEVYEGVDYGVRLAERLEAGGLRVGKQDLTSRNGRVPAARLHLISGGGTSVGDRSGWMGRGLDLTRTLAESAHRGEHTVLGVCLGSQMIAEALWPGSVRSSERIEVGLTEVLWRGTDLESDERLIVPAFHYHQIDRSFALQGGAEVVAENSCALQGFRLGSRLWGMQFHPELAPNDVRRLVEHHRATIEAQNYSVAAANQSVDLLESAWNPDVFDQILWRVTGEWPARR